MEIIQKTLRAVRLGEPQTVHHLTLFPLIGDVRRERDYLTLEEAIEARVAKITEISEGGSVPELLFLNEGDRPVLLVDGAALEGAKQNRILNLTIVVPPRSKTVIPVSCVEAGRWARHSAEFSPSDHYMYAAARAMKTAQVSDSLRTSRRRYSNQGAVWGDIAEKMVRMGSSSPSSAMTDMFAEHKRKLDDFAEAFEAVDGQVGVVVGLGDKISGVDLFDTAPTLRRYLGKLVRSYGMDALEAGENGDDLSREAA